MGVMSDAIFSALVIVIILSTLLTPPILTMIVGRSTAEGKVAAKPAFAMTKNP